MKTKKIMVRTRRDIENLVDLAGHVQGSIEIETKDNAKYDASSILGLFSVKPGSTMSVKYPESADDFEDFLTTLELTAMTSGY